MSCAQVTPLGRTTSDMGFDWVSDMVQVTHMSQLMDFTR